MARILWLAVIMLWLIAAARLVVAYRRSRPDHRLRDALEALRHFMPT